MTKADQALVTQFRAEAAVSISLALTESRKHRGKPTSLHRALSQDIFTSFLMPLFR